MTDRVGGLRVTNVPLRNVITMAYGIRDFQLSGGPGWIGTDRYDITAKPERVESVGAAADPMQMTDEQRKVRDEQWKTRVRKLLAERFGLVVHTETREAPIYLLTVAKTGSKLKEVTPVPGANQGTSGGRGRSQGMAAPVVLLTNTLSNILGRTVVDKTGLTGKYDYLLEWSPDVAAADATDAAAGSGPTIFTAVQEQLGLKLESSKGPVDTIVIDHVDRPSEN